MEQKINTCKSIEELFALWKAVQEEEGCADYLPKEIPADAFLPDGIISEEHYADAGTKLLFIAKEAYWYNDNTAKNKDGEYIFEPMFWHREVAFGNTDETIFSKRMSMLANAVFQNDYRTVNKEHTCLRSVAHINLNKRGGYSGSVWRMLEGYTAKYAQFIAREVELIKPDLIICCGNGVHWLMENYVQQYLEVVPRMIAVSHPSYFALSDENYLKQLECAVEGCAWVAETVKAIAEKPKTSIKGILFDTNKTYSDDALMDMLVNEKISAYEGAADLVNSFQVGDYAFFYVKGRGVVAGGRVVSPMAQRDEFQGDKELYKMVELLVPRKAPSSEQLLRALPPKEMEALLGLRFYYARTTKVPYLNEEEALKLLGALKKLYEN